MIDGFDEIKRDIRSKVINSINEFVEKYSTNKFLITSRPGANLELLPRFYNYTVNELIGDDVFEFIKKQKLSQKSIESVIEFLKNNNTVYLETYLSNPLLLTLYLVTYSVNSTIPDKRSTFYRRVFEVLFREHDSATKIGFERDFATNLSQQQFEEILKLFSFLSFFENEYSFNRDYLNKTLSKARKKIKDKFNDFPEFDISDFVDDLKVSIGILVEDEGVYSFIHRTMQEYFTASLIQTANINKEEIYRKIISKIGYISNLNSSRGEKIFQFYYVQSLLGLCKELDYFSYYNYVYIPLLKEAINLLENANNNSKKINAYFKIIPIYTLWGRARTDDNGKIYFINLISKDTNKYDLITNQNYENFWEIFNQKGYRVPSDMLKKVDLQHTDLDDDPVLDTDFHIDFSDQNINIEWIPKPELDAFLNLINNFLTQLKGQLSEAEQYIDNIIQSESSIIDLI
ncbi:hypothetical protein GCM10028808_07040 [Spirosoma migulaei]